MSIKVLLADPNEKWLKEAKAFFTENLFKVTCAYTGREAQAELFKQKFFAMILNMEIKDFSGIQVLRYCRSHNPNTKILLTMENESVLAENGLNLKNLNKLGIHDYFVSPYELKSLKATLDNFTGLTGLKYRTAVRDGQSPEQQIEEEDEKFSPIKIDEFYSGNSVLFDIFIRLNTGRYLKILHAGDSFSQDRIEKYKKEKGIEFLYISVDDRNKFIQLENALSSKIVQGTNFATETKIKILKNAGEKIVEEAYFRGVRPVLLEEAKDFCQNIFTLVHSNVRMKEIFSELEKLDPSAYTHSFLVCLFSNMLAKQFEWGSKIVNETLGIASVLHDVGLTRLPPEISRIRPFAMNEEELRLYKTHPALSDEILSNNSTVPALSRQIILQHHESGDGSGFPHGLSHHKILILARILYLTNEFTHIMIENKLTPVLAVKEILAQPQAINRYGPKILENFIKLFSDPDKIFRADAS